MKVISFYKSENKSYLINLLKDCSWDAGKYLAYLLKENKLKELCGENSDVYFLFLKDELLSFATLSDLDDIQPTTLTPWIGFVYTYEKYRGNKYSFTLIRELEKIAKKKKYQAVYISTNHIGLYEKCGYSFDQILNDIEGEPSRVYKKTL